MMERPRLFPLALLLVTGIFLIAACSDQPLIRGGGSTANDLIKTDIKPGDGPAATTGRRLMVHYTGWLYDEDAPENKGRKFESSRDSGKPYNFQLGAGYVIKGWDRGVAGMKVGGQRMLVIPPSLGFGARGSADGVPPNATLIYEIELLGMD